MSGVYERLVRPVLFRAYGGDAERVHSATLRAIHRVGELPPVRAAVAARYGLQQTQPAVVAGISFPGRVGLAAGLDKDGVGVKAWAALGFGHAEIGTVTAHAQPGNDRPRLFRLVQSRAIVNRMGFNNAGAEALAATLERAGIRRGNRAVGIPIGVSIGKTKTVPLAEAAEDYLSSARRLAPYADYLAVNVSSPNTPGLRTLQDGATLRRAAAGVDRRPATCRSSSSSPPTSPTTRWRTPSPSASRPVPQDLIATNTTVSRDGLDRIDRQRGTEAGGLSGAPLTRAGARGGRVPGRRAPSCRSSASVGC